MQRIPTKCPYRAIIGGEEHIVKGWRGGNLLTDKGKFIFRRHGDYPVPSDRLLEIALLQLDENGEWLLNGHNLRTLQSMRPAGGRLESITRGEVLRVHKSEIHAIAWVQVNGEKNTTEMLDQIIKFWKKILEPPKPVKEETFGGILQDFAFDLNFMRVFEGWSEPIWLKKFELKSQPKPTKLKITSAESVSIKIAAELKQTHAELQRAKEIAKSTMKEALLKWMRFDPLGMNAGTKARIEKAVKIYLTDPDKRSLKKIADEFKVSRTTVSKWFAKFTKETGHPVVTHQRHESVVNHLKADSEVMTEE